MKIEKQRKRQRELLSVMAQRCFSLSPEGDEEEQDDGNENRVCVEKGSNGNALQQLVVENETKEKRNDLPEETEIEALSEQPLSCTEEKERQNQQEEEVEMLSENDSIPSPAFTRKMQDKGGDKTDDLNSDIDPSSSNGEPLLSESEVPLEHETTNEQGEVSNSNDETEVENPISLDLKLTRCRRPTTATTSSMQRPPSQLLLSSKKQPSNKKTQNTIDLTNDCAPPTKKCTTKSNPPDSDDDFRNEFKISRSKAFADRQKEINRQHADLLRSYSSTQQPKASQPCILYSTCPCSNVNKQTLRTLLNNETSSSPQFSRTDGEIERALLSKLARLEKNIAYFKHLHHKTHRELKKHRSRIKSREAALIQQRFRDATKPRFLPDVDYNGCTTEVEGGGGDGLFSYQLCGDLPMDSDRALEARSVVFGLKTMVQPTLTQMMNCHFDDETTEKDTACEKPCRTDENKETSDAEAPTESVVWKAASSKENVPIKDTFQDMISKLPNTFVISNRREEALPKRHNTNGNDNNEVIFVDHSGISPEKLDQILEDTILTLEPTTMDGEKLYFDDMASENDDDDVGDGIDDNQGIEEMISANDKEIIQEADHDFNVLNRDNLPLEITAVEQTNEEESKHDSVLGDGYNSSPKEVAVSLSEQNDKGSNTDGDNHNICSNDTQEDAVIAKTINQSQESKSCTTEHGNDETNNDSTDNDSSDGMYDETDATLEQDGLNQLIDLFDNPPCEKGE